MGDDDWQFWNVFGGDMGQWPSTAVEHSFMQQLRTRGQSALSVLPKRHAVFAPACFDNCIFYWSAFSTVRIDGISTTRTTLEQFFFSGSVAQHVDTCAEFDCCLGYP